LVKNVANLQSKDKIVPFQGCDPSQVQQVIVKGTKIQKEVDPMAFLNRIESLQKLGAEADDIQDTHSLSMVVKT
jgi:hypothetical protein